LSFSEKGHNPYVNTIEKKVIKTNSGATYRASAISKKKLSLFVIPAKAGIQSFGLWIPHQVRNDTLEK
jgi:hypothetical protein